MSPSDADEWAAVANERAADAEALAGQREASVGSIYLVGYAVECSLKGFLQRYGKAFPRGGPGGHNLRDLWKKSGFRLSDVRDRTGTKTYFLTEWTTDLRYELVPAPGQSPKELLQGAKALSGWLQTRSRRVRRRR